MLQDIRANSQGTIAKIIIGLIVISFSIFGIESLLFSGGGNAVAEVNGEEISPFALQQELSVQQRQLLAMLGDNADPALLDQERLSQQALDNLIQREIVMQASSSLELTAPDRAIADIIGSMEQFKIDGQFSRDMFQSALASAGFTPALFRDRLAGDIRIGQLRAGIAGSDFTTPAELALAASIAMEGRDVRYIEVPLIDFLATSEVSEDEIVAFYGGNADRFQSEEELVLDYIELTLDDYREPVDEARLREEFELTRDEYELATESRVSHILFEGDADERRERAAEAQAALSSGMAFAEAAREYSDDVGSAAAGGDLGYTSGDTFPGAMEEAIAALGVGEQSGPVETDAGTHLLLVTDRREGSEVSFLDVAGEIEESLQRADASAALLRDVERLRDLAFNAADLADPASALGVEVSRSDAVTRTQSEGVFADPRLLRAAFSEDVLDAGHNSEVLELSPERFLALRVAERNPPAPRPLADVREEIRRELRESAARKAASAKAEALLAALEDGASVESQANESGLEWQVELGARRDSPRLPPLVRERVFAMAEPEEGAASRAIVSDGGDTTYVVELARVTPGDLAALPDQERSRLRQRLAGEAGGLVQQQYEAALRAAADVVIY
jgi:peptidyl-prolyl cis-trans isomerase D